jgi:Ca-activated chloride channel family protein
MPASIVLVLDVSGSMQGQPLENAKKGAMTFIDKMNRWDELEVKVFSNYVSTLVGINQVRDNGEVAKMKIQNLRANGDTRLYDAIKQGMSSVRERRKSFPGRRYGLIVLSDGRDTKSVMSASQLMGELPRGDSPDVIKLFTIAYGERADRGFLEKVARATNARMFQSTTEEIEKVYRELSANF